MSGIFGIVGAQRKPDKNRIPIADQIITMGHKMTHRPWYVVDTYSDAAKGVGLGRIGIGVFNQAQQPIVSEDHNLIIFFSGKLYNATDLRQRVVVHNPTTKGQTSDKTSQKPKDVQSDPDLVLRLYEQKGSAFIHDLQGAFVLAIWDQYHQQLLIANDRFGLYPLYYAHHNGSFIFAPQMKGVLCDPTLSRTLDMTAMAEYMRFQQLLGTKTFFEEITLLSHASVLHYDAKTDKLQIEPYWHFTDIPKLQVTFEEAVEEIGRRLEHAVQRITSEAYRPGIYLSGGLDSRTLLGLAKGDQCPLTSITYGQKNCRDVVYSKRIARKAGCDHHWFEFENGNWIAQNVDFHLELTEGFHSWIHAHGISILPHVRRLIDVNLTGYGGGSVVGGTFTLQDEPVDRTAFLCDTFTLYNQHHTWPSINEAEEAHLFTDKLFPQLRGVAFSSLTQEMERFEDDSFSRQAEAFKLINHDSRFIHNFLIFNSSHFENYYPFYDYQVVEFAYGLSPSLKFKKRLLRALINRNTPELAMVPYDKDDQLVTNRQLMRVTHKLTGRLSHWVNHHIQPIFPEYHTLYADYENYLRTDLRAWGQSMLFDPRTLSRGIFNAQFLESIWKRHQSGKEIHTIGKIAPIMTYEMMLRRFYD